MEQKIQKNFFVFQIIAFQLGVGNSDNFEQNTSHRQSMCYHSALPFHLKLGETFSKSTSTAMMKKHDKSALPWTFRKYLGRFHMWTVKACCETALFRECSNQGFQSL